MKKISAAYLILMVVCLCSSFFMLTWTIHRNYLVTEHFTDGTTDTFNFGNNPVAFDQMPIGPNGKLVQSIEMSAQVFLDYPSIIGTIGYFLAGLGCCYAAIRYQNEASTFDR